MVKIVIERRCKPGKEKEFHKLLVQMRGLTLTLHAYLSGEIYRNIDDPSVWVTIVAWLNLEGWKAWRASPERQEMMSKMEPLLVEPERTIVLDPVL